MLNMKHRKMFTLLGGVSLLILSVFLVACQGEPEAAAAPVGLRADAIDDLVEISAGEANDVAGPAVAGNAVQAPAGQNNNQARVQDRSEHDFDPQAMANLSAVEAEGLAYMREEEKLARDVYLALYDQWGQPIFQNIAGSEQAHMDSILLLLEQAGLVDPAAGLAAGEFNNPLFQSLYDDLVARGSLSLVDALAVGAGIEELDIVDLEERLTQTGNENIIQVYTNLLSGSENHLRAFVSNLERQSGQQYQPVYLDQDAYQAILAGGAGQGAGNGGNGAGGNGAGGNGGGANGGGANDGGGYRGGNGAGGNGRRNGQAGNA
jgi:hypothetical protein